MPGPPSVQSLLRGLARAAAEGEDEWDPACGPAPSGLDVDACREDLLALAQLQRPVRSKRESVAGCMRRCLLALRPALSKAEGDVCCSSLLRLADSGDDHEASKLWVLACLLRGHAKAYLEAAGTLKQAHALKHLARAVALAAFHLRR